MWVYRQGEISHSLAASEGPIHVITRIVCQLERAYIFSALEKKEQSMSCQQKKKDKRNIGSRMASYYRRRWVMPLEGRKLHVAISEKETCTIHRDWHDE